MTAPTDFFILGLEIGATLLLLSAIVDVITNVWCVWKGCKRLSLKGHQTFKTIETKKVSCFSGLQYGVFQANVNSAKTIFISFLKNGFLKSGIEFYTQDDLFVCKWNHFLSWTAKKPYEY